MTGKVTYPITAPDGREYPFTVPEGTPQNVVIGMFKKQWKPIGQQVPQGEEAYRGEIQRMDAGRQRQMTGQSAGDGQDSPNPFMAGMGSRFMDIYNSGKQGIGHAMNFVGAMSDEELAELEKQVQGDRRMGETLRDESGPASAGGFAGEMAAYSPLTYLRALKVLKNSPIKTGMATGGAVGATQVVDDPENRDPFRMKLRSLAAEARISTAVAKEIIKEYENIKRGEKNG